jgi:heme exporter protein A
MTASPMHTMKQIEAKQLSCIRQGKAIFTPVNFSLCAGHALLVAGPNGAGKSSLLRLISGTATPAEGCINWNGASIHTSLLDYVSDLHYIGHTNGIRLGLTITENLQLAGNLSQHAIKDLDEILTLLQLSADKHTQAQYLSAGQKRRIALARLFLIPRSLWILDEPLTSLDVNTQTILLQQIEKHLGAGGLCIMTSHQPIAFQMPLQQLQLAPC